VAFLRRRSKDLPQLAEEEVYARSYGERSDDVSNVQPVPAREEEPEPEKRLTDRGLRDAFRARLDQRDPG
jgi:hypothetical protein